MTRLPQRSLYAAVTCNLSPFITSIEVPLGNVTGVPDIIGILSPSEGYHTPIEFAPKLNRARAS